MAENKNKFALVDFFNSLFSNLGKLMLTNLIFAVPCAVFFTIFFFIDSLAGLGGNFITMLSAIPIFPFFAGVTLVTAKIVRGDEDFNVLKTFVLGLKDNFKKFLVHGVILYLAIVVSYFSISLYSMWISVSKESDSGFTAVLYVFFAISVIIAVAFLFISYYVPSMTVTFDMSLKTIYKNSALMSFGEFKNNLFATFGVAVFVLFSLTILFFTGNVNNAWLLIIVTAVIALLLAPSIVSFIINSAVYNGMYSIITEKDRKTRQIDKKIENRKKGQFFDYNLEEQENPAEEFLSLDIDENMDADEYIFFNGKMVKRSVILKMKKEQEESKGE